MLICRFSILMVCFIIKRANFHRQLFFRSCFYYENTAVVPRVVKMSYWEILILLDQVLFWLILNHAGSVRLRVSGVTPRLSLIALWKEQIFLLLFHRMLTAVLLPLLKMGPRFEAPLAWGGLQACVGFKNPGSNPRAKHLIQY